MSEDAHTIPVDVTNPGQFYACCGLLEVATALRPIQSVNGWFADGAFAMSVDPGEVLAEVAAGGIEVRPLPEGSARGRGEAHKISPMLVNGVLALDWWLDESSADFKTWAGGMSAPLSIAGLHAALAGGDWRASPLDFTAESQAATFCFDCRSGGDVIDNGGAWFGRATLAYPAVDLMAFVGLQRFRPAGARRRVKCYATWAAPLPAPLAAAVAAGCVPPLAADRYRFRLRPRDPAFRYKSFGRAEPCSFKEMHE